MILNMGVTPGSLSYTCEKETAQCVSPLGATAMAGRDKTPPVLGKKAGGFADGLNRANLELYEIACGKFRTAH